MLEVLNDPTQKSGFSAIGYQRSKVIPAKMKVKELLATKIK